MQRRLFAAKYDEMNLTKARMRRGRFGITEPINDDLDCIDAVTQQWAQGDGCFENDTSLVTLEELFVDDGEGGILEQAVNTL